MREAFEWRALGVCDYDRALALQESLWHARRAGGPDVCLALEHPPTITFGRRAHATELLISRAALAERGIACAVTERGGRVTYHGPGQLVIYPVLDIQARGFGVGDFVWALEGVMITIAEAFGIRARRDAAGRGVWAAGGKLGAVGIRVRNGISTHGLALNVTTDLQPYGYIVPCGMPDLAVTSLDHEGVEHASVAAVLPVAERACVQWLSARTVGVAAEEARL